VYVYLTLEDEGLELESILIVSVKDLNLDDSIGLINGLSTLYRVRLERDKHSQVLKDVN
jgi:hypothetical protein